MRKRCPHYLSKMVAVTGDCLKPGVGINSEDRQTLVDNIHVVFHCAATVRFDAHLKVAVSINLRATKALLEMAKEMKQLKVSFWGAVFQSLPIVSKVFSNKISVPLTELIVSLQIFISEWFLQIKLIPRARQCLNP
jgi:Putative dehydrogenase domain of multifunctional non-ribosomal peptide synthetases and related enzymes